jgi:hypothetical protein
MTNSDPVDVRKLLAPLPVKESRASRTVRRLDLPSRLVASVIAVVVVVGILIVAFGLDFPSKFQAVDAVKTFCGAETDGKYDVAYGLLSARIQRQMNADDLQRASKAARFTGCALNVSGFSLNVSGAAATVPVEFELIPGSSGATGGNSGANDAGNGGTTKGTMTLVREAGGWRIDGITSADFQLLPA